MQTTIRFLSNIKYQKVQDKLCINAVIESNFCMGNIESILFKMFSLFISLDISSINYNICTIRTVSTIMSKQSFLIYYSSYKINMFQLNFFIKTNKNTN